MNLIKLFVLPLFLFLGNFSLTSNDILMEKSKVSSCPSSPNCVCTQDVRNKKRMQPMTFSGSVAVAKERLEKIINNFSNTKLVKSEDNYLHYEFQTKIGKFIDDVEFLFDEKTKHLHFRSASQKGYYDFGKNKRRMKKIKKAWRNSTIQSEQKN